MKGGDLGKVLSDSPLGGGRPAPGAPNPHASGKAEQAVEGGGEKTTLIPVKAAGCLSESRLWMKDPMFPVK